MADAAVVSRPAAASVAGSSTAIDEAIFDATRPLVFSAIPGPVDKSDNPNFGQAAAAAAFRQLAHVPRRTRRDLRRLGFPLTSDRDSPGAQRCNAPGVRFLVHLLIVIVIAMGPGLEVGGRIVTGMPGSAIALSAAAEQGKPLLERIASLAEGCCAPTLQPHA